MSRLLRGAPVAGLAGLGLVLVALALARRGTGPQSSSGRGGDREGVQASGPAPRSLGVRVLAVYPHDPEAYTQGLLWQKGELWESTGLHGRSTLRRVELESGTVLDEVSLPPEVFAEGLAAVGEHLVQLSWRNGLAFRWARLDLAKVGEHRYEGEGWGLSFDGDSLVMSDGSAVLTFRDPRSFAVRRRAEVHLAGAPLYQLNELECVEGKIYANVYAEDRIVRIDPQSATVEAVIDARGLLSAPERAAADVLNGIAYRADRQTFLLTGKLWPWLFEVVWVDS